MKQNYNRLGTIELFERENTTRSTEEEIISYCENKSWQDGETERKYRKKTNWDGR